MYEDWEPNTPGWTAVPDLLLEGGTVWVHKTDGKVDLCLARATVSNDEDLIVSVILDPLIGSEDLGGEVLSEHPTWQEALEAAEDTLFEIKTTYTPTSGKGVHQRIYPYMTEVVQYGNERGVQTPWIARDRSSALRSERKGYGRAICRVWTPSEWAAVNREEK